MNIIFVNKVSEAGWRNTLRRPEHYQQLIDWLGNFMKSVCSETENDIKLNGGSNTSYDVCNITGYIEELTIYCRGNDLVPGPNGPISKEFSWNLYAHPVDNYGSRISDKGRFIDSGRFTNVSSDPLNPHWI